jgi:hypothetical protein
MVEFRVLADLSLILANFLHEKVAEWVRLLVDHVVPVMADRWLRTTWLKLPGSA